MVLQKIACLNSYWFYPLPLTNGFNPFALKQYTNYGNGKCKVIDNYHKSKQTNKKLSKALPGLSGLRVLAVCPASPSVNICTL